LSNSGGWIRSGRFFVGAKGMLKGADEQRGTEKNFLSENSASAESSLSWRILTHPA